MIGSDHDENPCKCDEEALPDSGYDTQNLGVRKGSLCVDACNAVHSSCGGEKGEGEHKEEVGDEEGKEGCPFISDISFPVFGSGRARMLFDKLLIVADLVDERHRDKVMGEEQEAKG